MGNASGKKESENVYTSEELRFLETAYRNASGGALEKLTSDRLVVRTTFCSVYVWVVALRCSRCSPKINAVLRSQVQGSAQIQCHATPEREAHAHTHSISTHTYVCSIYFVQVKATLSVILLALCIDYGQCVYNLFALRICGSSLFYFCLFFAFV